MHLASLVRTLLRGGSRQRLAVGLCVGVIVALALVASIASLALAASSFPDVPNTHPYYTAITDLASRGIIGGYGNGNFGPGDTVTRQQFAKMIVGTGGYPVSESDICPFGDVSKGGAGTLFPDNFVAVCAANGITTGYTATLFKPYNNITRYQVISMVVRMANNLQPSLLATPPADWAATGTWRNDATHGANAARAEYNGLLEGLNLVALTPSGNMTRGEVAQVLHNLLGVLIPTDTTTTTAPTTTTTAPTTTTTDLPSGSVIASFSGSGDDVLDFQKPAGPALVWISGNAASAYFGVKSFGQGDDGPYTWFDLLANETEPYQGIRLIDYHHYYTDQKLTTRFEVKATGPWSIEVRPLSSARTLGTPGQIQGTGDDVILVTGSPSTARIVGNAEARYFGVKAYYSATTSYDLLANETDPYDGTVMFSKSNAYLIEVQASGPWSISTQP